MTVEFSGPDFRISGATAPAGWMDQLTQVKVDRALNLVGRATLRFIDHDYKLLKSGRVKIGTPVEVRQGAQSDQYRPGLGSGAVLFHGEVTALAVDQGPDGTVELTITADELSHKLRRGTTQRTYLQMSYADVISNVASAAGLAFNNKAAGGEVFPYLLQSGQDLAFVGDLVRRAGLQWRMDKAALVLEKVGAGKNAAPTATLAVGDTQPTKIGLQHFSLKASGLEAGVVEVTSWDPKNKQPLVGQAPAKAVFSEAEAKSTFETPAPTKKRLVGSQGMATQKEAESVAQTIQADAAAGAVTVRGTTTEVDGRIQIGSTVKIEQVGPAAGTYVVTSLQHHYDQRGFRTTFTAGSHRPSGLVDVLQTSREDAGLTRHDLVVGIVTDNKDPEKLGRVQVKWVASSGQSIETPWARVLSPDAGNGRGFVFLPEIEDEVLIAFEYGDTRRPVVLGGLFGGKVKLPTKDQDNIKDGSVSHRRITSRTGHIVDLDDTAGAEQVLLVHKDGHQVLIGKDKLEVTTVKNKPIILSNGKAKVELAENGDITLDGNNVTIKAKMKVALEGTDVAAKATNAAELSGATASVKASAQGTVQAGAILALKGAQVMVN